LALPEFNVRKRRAVKVLARETCISSKAPATDMSTPSLLRLLALSAIWGASFLFMRIGAPVLGPALLIELRVALAAVFLLIVGAILKRGLSIRENWKHYLVLGLFNSALPFLLFAFAAETLSASLLSILNATAPIWGAVIGAVWTRTALSARASLGLALGVLGVAMLVGFDPATLRVGAPLAIILGLAAAFSYGIATQYAKAAKKVEPFANAHGSMWAATFLIAPTVPFFSNAVIPSATVALAVLALGVLCSGVAYLLYFRLIVDIGAAPALTVTFLVPVFGVMWGHFLLDEPVGWNTLAGACVVIFGTALVTGFSPASLFAKKPAAAKA
jgi:drug/metabolite transporter (DMT)-like permease